MPSATTRIRIVEKADTLFYEAGFDATSFSDIAAAVGISRGNFYHHFKTKDQILNAVIRFRLERTREMLANWENNAETARDRILSFIQILIVNRANIMAYGCPAGTLCTELAKMDHASKDHANEIFVLFRGWLTQQFMLLGSDEQAGQHALHVLAWSQGVASIATTFRDEAFIRREVAEITIWLDRKINQLNTRLTGD